MAACVLPYRTATISCSRPGRSPTNLRAFSLSGLRTNEAHPKSMVLGHCDLYSHSFLCHRLAGTDKRPSLKGLVWLMLLRPNCSLPNPLIALG